MAVDYACWLMLWISGLEEEVGARFAPTPLRQDRVLHAAYPADVLTGAHGSGVVLENACRRRDTLLNSCG